MKRTTAAACGLSRIMFAAGVFCWFFYFFVVITEPDTVSLPAAVPVVCLAVSYCAGVMASGRGIKLLYYILMQAALCAAGTAALQYALKTGPDMFNLRLTSSMALVISMAVCAKAAASEIKAAEIARRFDAGLVLCALLMLADHYLKSAYGRTAVIVIGASLLLLLLSLAMIRSDKNAATGSAAGRAIPVILLVVIVLIAEMCAALGSGAAQNAASALVSAVRGLLGLIVSAAVFLWSGWESFCRWLASRLEPGESVPVNIVVPDEHPDMPEPVGPSHTSVVVLYVLTALLAAALIAAFVYAIRRTRLRRIKSGRLNNRLSVRRGGASDGLKKTLSALAVKIKYRVDCIRFRNTPAGLLAWCEAHVSGADRKLPAETGPQFVLRLAQGQSGEASDSLQRLAGLLEKAFYSPSPADADPSLCAAVRRCRFK